MWLVVGLGNPGSRYEDTRHNAGFLVVGEVARRWGLPAPKAQLGARVARGDIAGKPVLIAQPQSFMNCSGGPVGALLRFHEASMEELLVAHDDLDLDFGDVRVKRGGGHGGHRGLRDLGEQLGLEFLRVRVGISRPPQGLDSAAYVLGQWSDAERERLADLVAQAADAVEAVLAEGATAAMNRFNVRPRDRADTEQVRATGGGSNGGPTSITSAAEAPPSASALPSSTEEGADHA